VGDKLGKVSQVQRIDAPQDARFYRRKQFVPSSIRRP
jgi:hypothetical protein